MAPAPGHMWKGLRFWISMHSQTPQPSGRVCLLVVVMALSACRADPEAEPARKAAPGSAEITDNEPVTVDLDAIFPPGRGRDLVLNNCQTCHVWVPIVVLQMDEAAWYRNSLEHRERVEALSDEDFELLYAYLSSTFTPDRPVPELPKSLLEAWTAY